MLEPWNGYAVRNLENRNVVIKLQPLPITEIGKQAVEVDSHLWKLTIKANAGDAVDLANHFVVRTDVAEQWDRSYSGTTVGEWQSNQEKPTASAIVGTSLVFKLQNN